MRKPSLNDTGRVPVALGQGVVVHTPRARNVREILLRVCPLLILAAVLITRLSGCGYTVGSSFRPDIRTVAVPIFQNDTFRTGVEFQLTEAIQKELQRRGLRIAEEPYADTRLTGRIVEVRKDLLGESAFDDARELQVAFAVVIQWEDLRTSQYLTDQNILLPPEDTRFITYGRVAPEIGQSLATAKEEAMDRMARTIVNRMEMPW